GIGHRHRGAGGGARAAVRPLLPLAVGARAPDPGDGPRALHLAGDRRGARRTHRRPERARRGHDVRRRAAGGAVTDRPLVLCADDDEDILALVALRLERAGFDVVQTTDGEAAVQAAKERRPAVAVLDVMMPKRTGLEVLA